MTRFVALFVAPILALAASPASLFAQELTVYSGRSKNLVQPVIDAFEKESGAKVAVRYGGTAELAATILEEGKNSPADVFFAQDAGALGAIAVEGLFRELPEATLAKVSPKFRSPKGLWIGTSGRARVVAYSTKTLKESDLPESVQGFTAPEWKGRIGWAPGNGSFQAFVTALRVKLGDDGAAKWLKAIHANEPKVYPNNSSIVAAIGAGEVEVGFVNHYYLLNFLKEKGPDFPVRNYHPKGGDVGAMLNVAGVGILKTSKRAETAEKFVEFLLRPDVQKNFVEGEDKEYPLVEGVEPAPDMIPLSAIDAPDIDLGDLSDLKGTLAMLQDLGILE